MPPTSATATGIFLDPQDSAPIFQDLYEFSMGIWSLILTIQSLGDFEDTQRSRCRFQKRVAGIEERVNIFARYEVRDIEVPKGMGAEAIIRAQRSLTSAAVRHRPSESSSSFLGQHSEKIKEIVLAEHFMVRSVMSKAQDF
ncbi:unnamed protein product [Parascedosporium putredinis]|uniref:Uncharacterized protein n=1 Tax=Parascedosporium putredinis TaxID=1442378 RepID=A0A9P1GWE8_9PEZI|nr:unnamed protein product [Parascedosporium putredinis]CAI7988782.1 unnamed protein product [Parascedosporium putredinis]